MEKEILIKFGERIRLLRKNLNLSQEELAEKVNIHRTYIGNIERGEKNIGLLNIVKLAKALNVKAQELLEDLDD